MFFDLFKKKAKKVEETKELFILTDIRCSLSLLNYDDSHYMKKISYIAWADSESGICNEEKGYVGFVFDKDDYQSIGFALKDYEIYKVSCKVKREEDNEFYLLKEILEEKPYQPELERMQYKCLNPETIKDEELGTFTYQRDNDDFSGRVDWFGNSLEVNLETEERFGGGDSRDALVQFRIFYEERQEWERKMKEYVADNIATGVPSAFLQRITPDNIYMDPSGGFTFFYCYGDPKDGLTVGVEGNVEKGITGGRFVDMNQPLDFSKESNNP